MFSMIVNLNFGHSNRVMMSLIKAMRCWQNFRNPTKSWKSWDLSAIESILHWLTVRSRIKYKLAVLTYKVLNMRQPACLRDELSIYEPVRALRSSGRFQQRMPPTSTNSGRRKFRYSAPEIWNTLPYELRSASCIGTFRRSLKSQFFFKLFGLL